MAEVKQRVTPSPQIGGEQEGKIGAGAWMALTAALLGWMFDGAEMGIFSMVGRSAVQDLMQRSLSELAAAEREGMIGLWFGVITAGFLVGAATGGVVFGWLGDRIGRVRAMTLSVLTYALFTGLCGFAGEAWQVGVLRFIAALGMGGEWSLGVALVMEVWPNRSRAFMAGLIGAAANVGYMIVGFVGLVLADWLKSVEGWLSAAGMAESTVQMLVAYKGWRLMMMLGTLPAALTFFIRMFVPESEKWQHEQEKGTTSHWATQDLLAVLVGVIGPALIVYVWAFERTAIGGFVLDHSTTLRIAATVLGFAIATIGYTYPVIRFFQRQAAFDSRTRDWRPIFNRMLLGACLSGVALLGTWGSTQWAPTFADKLAESEQAARVTALTEAGDLEAAAAAKAQPRRAREWTLIWISIGAIVGTLMAAAMGDLMGRRAAYCALCALSLASVYIFYLGQHQYGNVFLFWAFIAGTFTASFYGWLPLYLPELFPTSMRATGQGFSFNFGRILAAIGVLQTGNLMGLFQEDLVLGGFKIPHGYPLACSTMSLIYLVGMVLIWFVPETRGKPLPE
jgi:SHS family sialic acid transporter-like MFS transporter